MTHFIANYPSANTDAWKRIVVLGDSITQNGRFVRLFQLHCSCRHPDRKIEVFNEGYSGGSAPHGYRRMERDVFSHQPDAVFIAFGINDLGISLYDDSAPDAEILEKRRQNIARYREYMTKIRDALTERGIFPVFMTPCAFDEYSRLITHRPQRISCNDVGVAQLIEVIHDLSLGIFPIIDLYTPPTRLFRSNPELMLTSDRVHPSPALHALIADTLAKAVFGTDSPSAGLPFPALPETEELERVYPLNALRCTNASATIDSSQLLSIVEAEGVELAKLLSMRKCEEMLGNYELTIETAMADDCAPFLCHTAPENETYYRNLLALYRDNLSIKDSITAKADELHQAYFAEQERLYNVLSMQGKAL